MTVDVIMLILLLFVDKTSNLKHIVKAQRVHYFCVTIWTSFFLFIWKMKALKLEVIFKSWWRKVCSNATHCTWWQRDSYFFAKNSPAPSDKLTIGYVPVKFVLWTFIGLRVLLLILVPGCLQHPSVETNSLETWMLSYANWGFSNLPHLYCLPDFVEHLRKLWTACTFLVSVQYLAISTCTPEVNKLCLTWIYCTVKT